VSDIPVGSAKIFADRKVIVAQPTAGEFKAFSAVCTHGGCLVNKIQGNTAVCPCHGGTYNLADGGVVSGPPPRPLPAVTVTVNGDNLTLG
jgi:Rieske Fe-S protein